MTTSRAHNYVKCEYCREDPANFVCRACVTYLCEECKEDHDIFFNFPFRKKPPKHDITELRTYNEELVGVLYCSDHKTKRMECFCDLCERPVCTDCIDLSHDGHDFKSISSAYEKIKKDLQRDKEEIEMDLIPKYTKLLDIEVENKSNLKTQADQIQDKIQSYTQDIIEMVKSIGEKTVQDLRVKEQNGLWNINETSEELKKKISRLKQIEKTLSDHINDTPGIEFFTPMDSNLLEEFETFPETFNYKLHDFQAGALPSIVAANFGTMPGFSICQADPSDTAGFWEDEECFSESESEMFSSGNLSQAEKCYMRFDLYDDNWDNIRDSDSETIF
ncbi:uncharacterized protein LOC144624306 [Crassostrea virginica]